MMRCLISLREILNYSKIPDNLKILEKGPIRKLRYSKIEMIKKFIIQTFEN